MGLWNGCQLMLASALNQLNVTITASRALPARSSTWGVNTFRLLESGWGSGSTLTVSSAVDDYAVHTFDTEGFGTVTPRVSSLTL
ncbi:MAG TPA: hypothetical protein VMS38_25635 [Pseudorhodoferax sp.]|nr:hypothetical protein [Pseudorhodoferax sp.]